MMLNLNLRSGVPSTYPSGSSLSKAMPIEKIPYFESSTQSEDFGEARIYYSLIDVANFLRIKVHKLKDVRKFNQKLGTEVIEKLCCQENLDLKVRGEGEIVGLRNFSALCSTSILRVDILVYFKELLVLFVEIQSSPMVFTERKAAIVGANVLRSIRAKNTDITEVSAFALPNTQGDAGACILKVQVEWAQFHFMTTLTRFKNIEDGVVALTTALRGQRYEMSLSSPYFITLSTSCCRRLCGKEGHQIECQHHVVVKSIDGYIYKLLYEAEEQQGFGEFLRIMRTKTALKNVIYPEDVTPPNRTTVLQKYRCSKFGPLNQAEARKCLRSFIVGAKSALDELHGIGLSHNDIRLPNFCFNANFEVILIDLDRVWLIGELYPMFYKEEKEGRSCMYKVDSNCYNGKHTDLMQLGLLVAWVLEPEELNYHERTLTSHSKFIREDKFISTLVNTYIFNTDLLYRSAVTDEMTLKKVLNERST